MDHMNTEIAASLTRLLLKEAEVEAKVSATALTKQFKALEYYDIVKLAAETGFIAGAAYGINRVERAKREGL